MPRGRTRVKKINIGTDDDSTVINDMFAQMTGSEDADIGVILPKIEKINTMLTKYIKIYKLLLGFNEFINNFPEYKPHFDDIKSFIDKVDIINDELNIKQINKESVQEVNTIYKQLKDKNELQSIIITSGNLGKHKRYLENGSNLGDEFIKREPGLSLIPLKFTRLDLKILWVSDKLTPMAKKFLLNVLSHTYNIGHNIYQIITSPDIDIKNFSSVLIKNIEKMKKRIPRCNKAFDIIADSVSMLENKFDGYYKTSVEAENPSIIIESFIIDVSMSQKSNASITAQFRKIIMHMKKQTANNTDPRVAKLFGILNNQFNLMKEETGETGEDGEDGETGEDEEDESNESISNLSLNETSSQV